MHLFIFSACLVTPSTAWEWFYEFAGSWCRPDNIVVLVHYAPHLSCLLDYRSRGHTRITPARRRVIGWTPIANFKISLLFASGVSIAIGFAEGAYRVLTGCVIVSEVVWIVRQLVVGFRIADAHCLGVCLRESSVVFSTRHSQLLSGLFA